MICKNCGSFVPDGAGICLDCNTKVENAEQGLNDNYQQMGLEKCPHCGHVGSGVPEKLLRPIDWIIIITTLFSGVGLIYLVYIFIKKGSPGKRNIVCSSCGAVLHQNSNANGGFSINQEDINKAKNVAGAVLKNPEIKRGFKKIKKSVKDFYDTL